MTKAENIADPNSCWNKAADDEEMFILLERDVASPETILDWCRRRIRMKKNIAGDEQLQEAVCCSLRMIENQESK